ncbi:MAG: hypothetical protein ABFD18_10180 [Syntrophomonas sp.]
MDNSANNIVRRPKSKISSYSINILHRRNPLVVAWWSLAYPGFGHFRLFSTVKGTILFAGESLINTQAHINLAIIYSFTGRFAEAKQILNTDLLILYCAILIYAIWDSYRVTIEINKLSILADHENASLIPMAMEATMLNSYEKRNPWMAAAWSALMPGLGHLYCVAIIQALFLLVFATIIIYFSHLYPAIGLVANGEFAKAQAILDPQWLLNFPSFYCFSIYDSYVRAVEYNKLFDQEQAQFFKRSYQSSLYPMPLQ